FSTLASSLSPPPTTSPLFPYTTLFRSRVFASVQPVRRGERMLPIEFRNRFLDILLRETHETEEPVQAERGIAAAARDLAILDGGALPQQRFGVAEPVACHVDHRHLKVRERKVRIEREGARRGAD